MCQSDPDERVPWPSIIGTGRLATIAALLDVPVERFFENAAATSGGDGEPAPRSDQEQLVALYLSLDPLNRGVALAMMRRLAAVLPELQLNSRLPHLDPGQAARRGDRWRMAVQSYPEPVLSTAAALNEMAAIGLAEWASVFDRFGADVMADALLVQVREHRARAIQLWALDGARRQNATRRQNYGP